jgi:hypothetical protein
VIGNHARLKKAGQLEPALAIRGAHHRDLDALVTLAKELDRRMSSTTMPTLCIFLTATCPI